MPRPYVRSKQDVKEGIGPLQGSEGTLVSDHQGMANLLNDYFVSVFTKESPFLDTCESSNSSSVSDVVFFRRFALYEIKRG